MLSNLISNTLIYNLIVVFSSTFFNWTMYWVRSGMTDFKLKFEVGLKTKTLSLNFDSCSFLYRIITGKTRTTINFFWNLETTCPVSASLGRSLNVFVEGKMMMIYFFTTFSITSTALYKFERFSKLI